MMVEKQKALDEMADFLDEVEESLEKIRAGLIDFILDVGKGGNRRELEEMNTDILFDTADELYEDIESEAGGRD